MYFVIVCIVLAGRESKEFQGKEDVWRRFLWSFEEWLEYAYYAFRVISVFILDVFLGWHESICSWNKVGPVSFNFQFNKVSFTYVSPKHGCWRCFLKSLFKKMLILLSVTQILINVKSKTGRRLYILETVIAHSFSH